MSQPNMSALMWKASRPSPNVKKARLYSSIIPSTAWCIEPSGPRSARPGPSMERSVVLSTAMSSQLIAEVVKSR